MKCLNGDLNQMYTQENFLRNRGISVTVDGGIPMVKTEDYERSIRAIYGNRIIGWWNYKESLISLGICTEEEFVKELKWLVERK